MRNAALAHFLVGPAEMQRVDADAAGSGIVSFSLMRNAGEAIAAVALRFYPGARRFVVLCGPGNNGGDGYVVARALTDAHADVWVFGQAAGKLRGDARSAFELWGGVAQALEDYRPAAGDVVIDAIFGAGLSKDLPDVVQQIISAVSELGLPVIAADIASGIDGESGQIRGKAFRAAHTVTFMCRKPGHLLLPGRDHAGTIHVADIGIPARLISARAGRLWENSPALWAHAIPEAGSASHKYSRGHLAVFSGGMTSSGAARLSAESALRAGAGAVTLVSPGEALAVNATHLTAVMLREASSSVLTDLLRDPRVTAFVAGPGYGAGAPLHELVLRLMAKTLVIDADAISSIALEPDPVFEAIRASHAQVIMTPHEGEFRRLFPDLVEESGSKVARAREAAERSGAVIVYKGADTVVAAPDGRAVINANAPPWLATAGSGDVLSGISGALLAQGVDTFEAACAAVWIHGKAGQMAGRGLTAETLVEKIAGALT